MLTIFNDCMQGRLNGLGFLMGGTPQFVEDTRRGLFSYEALRSRLAANRYAKEGLVDTTGPVLQLATLTPVSYTHLDVYKRQLRVPEDGLAADIAQEYLLKHVVRVAAVAGVRKG